MRCAAPKLLAAVLLGSLFFSSGCSDEAAVDDRLIGQWDAVVEPEGRPVHMRMHVRKTGILQTYVSGDGNRPPQTGKFSARSGQWRLENDEGVATGTYTFTGPETVTFAGADGAITWSRALPGRFNLDRRELPGGSAQMNAALGRSVHFPRVQWPVAGLDDLLQRAWMVAREWQRDAKLMRIEIIRRTDLVGGFVASDAGPIEFIITFHSDAAHETMTISPGAPGPDVQTEAKRGVARPPRSIPETFFGMDEAVRRAGEMGMDVREIKRAVLEDFSGRTVSGLSGLGLAWIIYPPSYSQTRPTAVPLRLAVDAMRTVDACAVVTSDEAANVLGRSVLTDGDSPRDHVWTCRHRATSGAHREALIRVDEDPYRDAAAFIKLQRRNQREVIRGLGDEAVLFNSPVGSTFLDIRVGETLIQINVDGDIPGTRHEAALTLGRIAVDRFERGIGVGLAKGPLGLVVGRWRAEYDGAQLEMTVNERLAVEISATRDARTVSGRGYVTRTEKGKAEFHLPGDVGKVVNLDFERSAVADRFEGSDRFEMLHFGVRSVSWVRTEPLRMTPPPDAIPDLEPFPADDAQMGMPPSGEPTSIEGIERELASDPR